MKFRENRQKSRRSRGATGLRAVGGPNTYGRIGNADNEKERARPRNEPDSYETLEDGKEASACALDPSRRAALARERLAATRLARERHGSR